MSRKPQDKHLHPWKKPILIDIHEGQFQYLGRWVNKESFRAFVYNDKGDNKLANDYEEYIDLTTSGLWFAKNPDTNDLKDVKDFKDVKDLKYTGNKKHDAVCPTS